VVINGRPEPRILFYALAVKLLNGTNHGTIKITQINESLRIFGLPKTQTFHWKSRF